MVENVELLNRLSEMLCVCACLFYFPTRVMAQKLHKQRYKQGSRSTAKKNIGEELQNPQRPQEAHRARDILGKPPGQYVRGPLGREDNASNQPWLTDGMLVVVLHCTDRAATLRIRLFLLL